MNLAGGVIGRATGTWTPQLFEEAFARPLQFGEHHLQLMPGKEMYLGGGSYFLPRDFLKLGQLFLNGGRWHGRRIVSAAWVQDATSAHSGLNAPNDYGYGWHLTTYRAHSVTYRAFEAQGNGGQLLVVVPRLKLVVQILAANYGDYMTWRTFRDLVERYVVAACR
jgi:CubicO group peptidase (beta-lactamase class C family)